MTSTTGPKSHQGTSHVARTLGKLRWQKLLLIWPDRYNSARFVAFTVHMLRNREAVAKSRCFVPQLASSKEKKNEQTNKNRNKRASFAGKILVQNLFKITVKKKNKQTNTHTHTHTHTHTSKKKCTPNWRCQKFVLFAGCPQKRAQIQLSSSDQKCHVSAGETGEELRVDEDGPVLPAARRALRVRDADRSLWC